MPQYLVYRHGSNAANQHMTEKEPIAIVKAKDREESIAIWANQRLEAIPESRAKKADWNYVLEQDAIRIASH